MAGALKDLLGGLNDLAKPSDGLLKLLLGDVPKEPRPAMGGALKDLLGGLNDLAKPSDGLLKLLLGDVSKDLPAPVDGP
jgi:hypothetical protein